MTSATVTEQQIKHLELIEKTISRQANHSFMIKGWALTITAAFFGFALTQKEEALAWLSAMPILLFWFLDSYYLYAERRYRCLFDDVRNTQTSVEPFSMDTKPYLSRWGRLRSAISITQFFLYVPLLCTAFFVASLTP